MEGSIFPVPAGASQHPRYARRPLSATHWRQLLTAWQRKVEQMLPQVCQWGPALPHPPMHCHISVKPECTYTPQSLLLQVQRRLQVAVAVPSYRVDPAALSVILDRSTCSAADVDVRWGTTVFVTQDASASLLGPCLCTPLPAAVSFLFHHLSAPQGAVTSPKKIKKITINFGLHNC